MYQELINKDKSYTDEDLKKAFTMARRTDNEKMYKSIDAKLGHTYFNVGYVYPFFEDYKKTLQNI